MNSFEASINPERLQDREYLMSLVSKFCPQFEPDDLRYLTIDNLRSILLETVKKQSATLPSPGTSGTPSPSNSKSSNTTFPLSLSGSSLSNNRSFSSVNSQSFPLFGPTPPTPLPPLTQFNFLQDVKTFPSTTTPNTHTKISTISTNNNQFETNP